MLTVDITRRLNHFTLQVNFEVEDEVVILFGPSGSGKSTILNCIAGMVNPDSGRIQLGDRTFYQSGRKAMPIQKRRIGYLFQDHALFPHMNVAQNVLYGTKDRGLDLQSPLIQELLEMMGIHHLWNQYPHTISGGEKQRVALARALATEPALLLLDEPFSSLDIETRVQCYGILKSLRQKWKIPVILVTHEMEEARELGDRTLKIEKGKLLIE